MTNTVTKMKEKICEVTTVDNAREYFKTSEKFTFCIDLLEISATRADSDKWVNMLEDNFEKLNELFYCD